MSIVTLKTIQHVILMVRAQKNDFITLLQITTKLIVRLTHYSVGGGVKDNISIKSKLPSTLIIRYQGFN